MNKDICCPKFNPKGWDGKELVWKNKPFVKDKVCCLFHIPLNFGKVITRMWKKVQDAKAQPEEYEDWLLLSHDVSLWKSIQYLAVSKSVEGMENVKLSGRYLTKVFEGPYKDAGKWYKEMQEYVKSKKKVAKNIYFNYTTCPKCAKKYGKNYVVLFAEI
jgi:effector-binding domain-containing protein